MKSRRFFDVFSPLLGGGLLGIIGISIISAYATLLYRNGAVEYVPVGLAMMLLGTALATLIVARFGQQQGVVIGPDESSVIILSGLLSTLPMAGLSAVTQAVYLALHLFLTTMLVGLVFIIFGKYRLGKLVRYIPQPVISGFILGSGLLLLLAGLGLAVDHPLSFTDWQAWSALGQQSQVLLPAMLLAGLLVWLPGRYSSPYVFPGLLIASIGVFFAFATAIGMNHDAMVNAKLLFSVDQDGGSLDKTVLWQALQSIDFSILLASLPSMIVVAGVALITALLQMVTLEQTLKEDVEENRELKVHGVANLLGGMLGALPNVAFIGDTLLNRALSKDVVASNYIIAVFMILGIFFSNELISILPVFVLAALLVFFGTCLVLDTYEKAKASIKIADVMIVCCVALIICTFGFVEGAAAGVVFASAIFLFEYSRLETVRHQLSSKSFRSRVSRPAELQQLLASSDWLSVYIVEGFIFFGGAQQLYDKIKQATDSAKDKTLVIDFSSVKGIDSTAVNMLGKLADWWQEAGGKVKFSGCKRNLLAQLYPLASHGIHFVKSLDLAVQFAEDDYLSGSQRSEQMHVCDFMDEIKGIAEHLEYPAGTLMIRQGEPAKGIIMLQHGSASVRITLKNNRQIRVKKFTSGTILGEISYYLNGQAVANVYANEKVEAWRLSPDVLARLEQEKPDVALRLHKMIASTLASRVVDGNTMLAFTV